MPTYSYHCDECGHDFDAVQRFSEDALTECPVCAGAIRRVIQPVGVVFKGSGWYINDSRPKSSGDGDSSSGAASKKASGDTASKADSASKSDTASKAETSSKSESSTVKAAS